jgi:hypothetical protein
MLQSLNLSPKLHRVSRPRTNQRPLHLCHEGWFYHVLPMREKRPEQDR